MSSSVRLRANAAKWSRAFHLCWITALVACGAVASSNPPTGIIPRPNLTGNCILTANSGWMDASASGKVAVFGKNVTETGSCGYTIGGTVTGIPMTVTVEALCGYVGYLYDAGAGTLTCYCSGMRPTLGLLA